MTDHAAAVGDEPNLTVVVGARQVEAAPDACLAALEPQARRGVEVLVVDDGGPGHYPGWVTRLVRPGALVPELWSVGIEAARGEIIALTSSTVVPGPDFVARTIRLHDGMDAAAGIGGPIDPGRGLGLVDWAVYFCRYARYASPITDSDSLEVAADNASYRAEALRTYRAMFTEAFWEPFVHDAMRRDGLRLAVRPDRVVTHAPGMRLGTFCRQRFLHGRAHGERRSAGMRRRSILAASLSAVLVPPLLTARAGRAVAAKRRHVARFVLALPLVLWFYSWWAAGELAGRIRAVRGGGRR